MREFFFQNALLAEIVNGKSAKTPGKRFNKEVCLSLGGPLSGIGCVLPASACWSQGGLGVALTLQYGVHESTQKAVSAAPTFLMEFVFPAVTIITIINLLTAKHRIPI